MRQMVVPGRHAQPTRAAIPGVLTASTCARWGGGETRAWPAGKHCGATAQWLAPTVVSSVRRIEGGSRTSRRAPAPLQAGHAAGAACTLCQAWRGGNAVIFSTQSGRIAARQEARSKVGRRRPTDRPRGPPLAPVERRRLPRPTPAPSACTLCLRACSAGGANSWEGMLQRVHRCLCAAHASLPSVSLLAHSQNHSHTPTKRSGLRLRQQRGHLCGRSLMDDAPGGGGAAITQELIGAPCGAPAFWLAAPRGRAHAGAPSSRGRSLRHLQPLPAAPAPLHQRPAAVWRPHAPLAGHRRRRSGRLATASSLLLSDPPCACCPPCPPSPGRLGLLWPQQTVCAVGHRPARGVCGGSGRAGRRPRR